MQNNKRVQIKEIVRANLERMGTADIDEIIEIIRPHYEFDYEKLAERELRNKARRVMGSFKDDKNVRVYFSDNTGRYINIENTDSLEDLGKINKQLYKKYSGLSAALKKVRKITLAFRRRFSENSDE